MPQSRTSFALLATLLGSCAFAAPLSAQDQLVKMALKRIERAEAGLKTLAAGDVRTANRLLADLTWAGKRLKGAYKKNTVHWKNAAKRLNAADKAIRARATAAPGATPKKPVGTQPGRTTKTPTKQPAAGNVAVVGALFEKLKQLDKEVNNGFRNLRMLNKTFMGDAYRVGSTTKEIAKLKARLAEFPQGDKNVKIVAGNLAKFEALFEKWKAEYAADTNASKGLGTKLDTLKAKYSSKSVPGAIYWPFKLENLTMWAQRAQKILDEAPKDLAMLNRASKNSLVGRKASSMRAWISRSVRSLQQEIQKVRYQCDGAVRDSLQVAKTLRSIKPEDRNAIVNRVLAEGALDRSMGQLQKGLGAVAQAAALDTAFRVKNGPDRKAQHKEIESTIGVLRNLAKIGLANVRMPKPVKVDAATMAKLTKIAQSTLARKKYGVNPIVKLVVTSKLQRKEKKEGTIRGNVVGATITTYHYVWDEYRVVTAEKIGDEVWVYHNLLKFYHSSDSITPQDIWFLSRRFKSTQILPENLGK